MNSSYIIFNIWSRIRFKYIAKFDDVVLIAWEVCKNVHFWAVREFLILGNYDAQLDLTTTDTVCDHIYKGK